MNIDGNPAKSSSRMSMSWSPNELPWLSIVSKIGGGVNTQTAEIDLYIAHYYQVLNQQVAKGHKSPKTTS
jgi:hypothetical protein